MLRNMRRRHWAAATKAGPVINVYQTERTVWGHQAIPTIDIQAQDLAGLPGQRIEMLVVNRRAVCGMLSSGGKAMTCERPGPTTTGVMAA